MLSDTQPGTGIPAQPTVREPTSNLQGFAEHRGWKVGGLVALIVLALGVSAAALIPAATSSQALESALKHTIARGDLLVTVTEQGTLESSNNTEIKCRVRGDNTIIWAIESGTEVKPGDELVRLDTLLIEEEISERTKFAHLARSDVARSKADVAKAKLAIDEYLEGTFVSELATLEKELAIKESTLRTSKNMLDHAGMMAKSGYVSELEVEENEFRVTQANLNLDLIKTQIDVLKQFTMREELATREGELNAAKAQHEANKERAYADEQRLLRAEEEYEYCVVKAEKRGMVLYPTAHEWEEAPDIEEGATVHKDQVLLLIPDLTKMQVKVGIHESVIDRIEPGLTARVTLPDKTFEGEVSLVSPIAQPAGWWTGNVVKYDTVVELPPGQGLKPGMTAEVEVVMARYEDVLLVPTAAVLETTRGYACWVETSDGLQRRQLELGDGSDMFIVVEKGLQEGDEVVLDPLGSLEEAQTEAAKLREDSAEQEDSAKSARSTRLDESSDDG